MSNTTSGGGDKDKVKGSPFITTSDVLNRLNAALTEQMGDHSDGEPSIPLGAGTRQARFELQKRLPDGSAIPASPADLSTADFENKLSQAAAFVQDLTVDQKLQWAEGQRNYGNQLYEAQQYEQAIDVYLTCLTVTADKKINDPALHLLFAKVMNNLALTTMQLQWYGKTVQFCSISLQELAERCDDGSSDNNEHSDEMCSQRSKLYFRRAKASRLRGDYALASDDLEHATRWLERMDDDPMVAAPLRNAVNKEHQLLARAQTEAKRNETKQKRAMQQLLTSSPKAGDRALHSTTTTTTTAPSLYQDLGMRRRRRQREFSTLRAPVHARNTNNQNPSYLQEYLARIGNGAQQLLNWLDERESHRQHFKQD